MGDNYLMLGGERVDLTDEQIEKLGLKEENPFCVKGATHYYYITNRGSVCKYYYADDACDRKMIAVANACKDKKLMEQRAMHETLDRLLWRFSCENGELENPWDGNSSHYFIVKHDGFYVSCRQSEKVAPINFPSEEIAKQAIDRIVVPFCTTHPDFEW